MAASSPVNVDALIIPANGTDQCAAVRAMTQAIAVLRADLDYRVEPTRGSDENVPAFEFARAIGAMVMPPGTIMAFKVAGSSTDAEALQAALDDVVAVGWGTLGEGETPWFYLCDGNHGTPNLVGKFIMGAGAVSEDETYPANDSGGAKTVELGTDHLPDHSHRLGAYGTGAMGAGKEGDLAIEAIGAVDTSEKTGNFVHTIDAGDSTEAFSKYNTVTGGVHAEIARTGDNEITPVPTLPPYVVLVYAMRSSRMV